MKVNVQELFSFPLKDKNWVVKILIGGLFMLCGLFIVPLVFPAGYIIRIMRDAINKQKPALPEWKDWEGFLKDGLMACIVVVAYVIPCVIVVAIAGSMFCFIARIIPIFGIFAFFFTKMILPLVFAIVISPVIAIGICLFLGTGEISSAFQIQKILEIYKKGLTEYIIISIVGLTLGGASLILGVTVVLIPLIPFLSFYIKVVVSRMYSEAFIKYVEEDEEGSVPQK